jgi:hypothetical protein
MLKRPGLARMRGLAVHFILLGRNSSGEISFAGFNKLEDVSSSTGGNRGRSSGREAVVGGELIAGVAAGPIIPAATRAPTSAATGNQAGDRSQRPGDGAPEPAGGLLFAPRCNFAAQIP